LTDAGICYDAVSMSGLTLLLKTDDFKKPEDAAKEWSENAMRAKNIFNL